MFPVFVSRQRKAALSMKQPCSGRQMWCTNSSVQVRRTDEHLLSGAISESTHDCCLSLIRYRCKHGWPEGVNGTGRCQGNALAEEQRDSCSHLRWILIVKTSTGNYSVDYTFGEGDTMSCLSATGHMTGKPPDIDLPPPPIPPPLESPRPRKKSKRLPVLINPENTSSYSTVNLVTLSHLVSLQFKLTILVWDYFWDYLLWLTVKYAAVFFMLWNHCSRNTSAFLFVYTKSL